jgi:hypothetical protein
MTLDSAKIWISITIATAVVMGVPARLHAEKRPSQSVIQRIAAVFNGQFEDNEGDAERLNRKSDSSRDIPTSVSHVSGRVSSGICRGSANLRRLIELTLARTGGFRIAMNKDSLIDEIDTLWFERVYIRNIEGKDVSIVRDDALVYFTIDPTEWYGCEYHVGLFGHRHKRDSVTIVRPLEEELQVLLDFVLCRLDTDERTALLPRHSPTAACAGCSNGPLMPNNGIPTVLVISTLFRRRRRNTVDR